MRLQLAIPENTFLTPVTFNRMLSLYGATALFLFALPLAIGFFYYLTPLQIGARGTALPRLGQLGAWLYIAGAAVLYAGFSSPPPRPASTRSPRSTNSPSSPTTGSTPGPRRPGWRRSASS